MEQSKEQTLRVMAILDKYDGTLEEKFKRADKEISELARQIGREMKGELDPQPDTQGPAIKADAVKQMYLILCNKFARGNFDAMDAVELESMQTVWPVDVKVRDFESFKRVLELARGR